MIHQPLGGARGQATDIQIQAREIQRIRENINEIFMNTTGKDQEQIIADTDRDNFMTAAEAKKYGIVDEVIARPKKSKKSESKD